MASVTLYLKDCDFSAWCNGGEDYATMSSNDRNLKGQFNGAGLNLTQYKITAIGIYGDYKRNTGLTYPMGNTNRGATLYNGSSISSIGSAISTQEDGDSKMSGDYAGFTNYYTTDTNVINSLINQINNGLVVTINLHSDNKGSTSGYRIYGKNIRLVVTYEEKPKYTLTVNANTNTGGTVSGGGTYYNGVTATLTATAKTGYKFKQWSDGNTSATRTVTVTGNATYTAVFERLYYDVNYDNLLSFADWYYSNSNNPSGSGSGTVTADVINGTITVNGSGDFYTAYSPVSPYHLIPVVAGQQYIFRYDVNTTSSKQSYVFYYNDSGQFVNDPTTGVPHIGTYNDNHLTFIPPNGCTKVGFRVGITDTCTAVFSNLALYKTSLDYAITNRQYRKNFVGGGAVGELYTPVIEGFDFKGWYIGENGTGTQITSSSKLSASTTVYSQWSIKTYTVTFKDENGATLKTETVNHGSTVTAPSDPTKADTAQWDYTFDDWYDANGNKWYPNRAITSDTIYTARYTTEVQKYTVKWYNEDGSVLLETDESVPYGTMPTYNGATPTKAETAENTYEHIGWSIDITSSGTTDLSAVVESVSYYARFRAISKGYTVAWKNEDGTVLETDTLVPYGTQPDYNGATPEKASDVQYDYTFLGWSANVNDPPLDDTQLETVKGDITYTAVYTKTLKLYPIKVILFDDEYTSVVEYGSDIVLEAPAVIGYKFTKWTDGNTDNPRTVRVTGEATYQAVYERIPVPIMVNNEQVTGVYIVPSTQTIVYVISGEVPTVETKRDTVDDWNFEVSNSVPGNSYPLEKLYINETRIW